MERLKGALYFVPGRRGGRYPYCNALFIDAGEGALLDAGADPKELAGLVSRTGKVFLSHFHSDHVRELRMFPEASVFAHEKEKPAVESWAGMVPFVLFPDERMDPVWEGRKQKEVGGWGWPVAGVFQDGQEFQVGGVPFIALHLPGHTIGHSGFWFPEERVLFTADVDLTKFGPWYGNSCSNLGQFLESIRRLEELDPEITVTGHEAGVIKGDIKERLNTYREVILARHARIIGFLDKPRTLQEIVAKGFIYGKYYSPDNSIHPQELRMVRHHLAYGMEQGEIVKQGEFYRAV